MRILTLDIVEGESRGWGSITLEPGQAALLVRNGNCYQKSLEEKTPEIKEIFKGNPSFSLDENLKLIELTHPVVSRVQGVFYAPTLQDGNDGLLYLNIGRAIPQYKLGKRQMLPEEGVILNRRLIENKKIKMSGDFDVLMFTLGSFRSYVLSAVKGP